MLMPAEQLQRLIDLTAARQHQTDQIMRARQMGDEEAARFYELKPEQQATLYAREAIADATEAARVGDVNGLRQGIRTAVEKVVYEGAQLGKPQRIVPRRKRGR